MPYPWLPPRGKPDKKAVFSPHCGDETTTNSNRAFGIRRLHLHGMVNTRLFPSLFRWRAPCRRHLIRRFFGTSRNKASTVFHDAAWGLFAQTENKHNLQMVISVLSDAAFSFNSLLAWGKCGIVWTGPTRPQSPPPPQMWLHSGRENVFRLGYVFSQATAHSQ